VTVFEKEMVMIKLESMAVEMPEVAGHPNRAAFRGVLTMVDVPSQRAPSGASGHLVVLTKKAAEAALPSLLGMALDYSPTLDRHDVRRKVGVITSAEIIGRNLEVGGYLFARDFPEIVNEIGRAGRGGQIDCACPAGESFHTVHAEGRGKIRSSWDEVYRFRSSLWAAAERIQMLTARLRDPGAMQECARGYCRTIRAETAIATAGPAGLGLSYEVTDVTLGNATAQIWALEKVTFTGAAILRRDKAAYRDTWIELCGS
jgi:hypothetical protein